MGDPYINNKGNKLTNSVENQQVNFDIILTNEILTRYSAIYLKRRLFNTTVFDVKKQTIFKLVKYVVRYIKISVRCTCFNANEW